MIFPTSAPSSFFFVPLSRASVRRFYEGIPCFGSLGTHVKRLGISPGAYVSLHGWGVFFFLYSSGFCGIYGKGIEGDSTDRFFKHMQDIPPGTETRRDFVYILSDGAFLRRAFICLIERSIFVHTSNGIYGRVAAHAILVRIIASHHG